jgi:hypothetical protein
MKEKKKKDKNYKKKMQPKHFPKEKKNNKTDRR